MLIAPRECGLEMTQSKQVYSISYKICTCKIEVLFYLSNLKKGHGKQRTNVVSCLEEMHWTLPCLDL